MKIRLFLLVAFSVCAATTGFAQLEAMPVLARRSLEANFRSWEIAEIRSEIVEHHKTEKSPGFPNAIKGDWNGDGKTDYAFLLQSRSDKEKRILVALIASRAGFTQHLIGEAFDGIAFEKKGITRHDFDRNKALRLKNDAIFSFIWEKSGTSYFWQNGRFRGVLTSD